MNPRQTVTALIASLTFAVSLSAQAAGGWVDTRQHNQHARIQSGVANGDMTRTQARRLHGQQRRIARLERRLGADGWYSPRDRRRLDRALDRSSRRIAGAKHGRRHRGHRRPHDGGYAHNTEINNYYGGEEMEVVEESATVNRSFEVDFDGVRVIWSSAGSL